MAEITIEVGALHANLHEQMEEMMDGQYNDALREKTEDFIHDTYRQIERAQEQQNAEPDAEDLDFDDQ